MSAQSPFHTENSVLQKLEIDALTRRNIELYVKRDDLIHPIVSGNKWRKLKHNVLQAKQVGSAGILTFGGAYSNHLIATACACKESGLQSIGLVRGEELNETSNETLKACHEMGMKLIFVDRTEYRMKNDWEYQLNWKDQHPGFYLVPEGGANYYGMIGCQEIWREIPFTPDHLFVAQGTSTTSCGLLLAKPGRTTLHVLPVLKGFEAKEEMRNLLLQAHLELNFIDEIVDEVSVHEHYHFGGYGKFNRELLDFIRSVAETYDLPLDHVYTSKAFYGMMNELQSSIYEGKKIVFLHTGGLQGTKLETLISS